MITTISVRDRMFAPARGRYLDCNLRGDDMSEAILALADRVTASSPREAAPSHTLILQFPGGTLPLQSAISVGADGSNQVVLEDRFVSRFHCRLSPHAGRWLLKDLDSTNGTYLDGNRIAEADIDAGARIRVGSQELRIERAGPRLQPSLPGLVARDPALAPVLDLLRRAAPSTLPVTLLGESGTGKEVAARAVHELSERNGGPFVPLNCGAISRELAEAELFGHEKGAFTGAITSAPGAFGAADGGTLFLDEIGDLPLPLQVKLLRALEAGEVKPVGAPRPRRIDVRVVCATHHDLRARVREGAFREDLFYRLRGVTVELPPLRARPHDILPLAEHFLPPCRSFAPAAPPERRPSAIAGPATSASSGTWSSWLRCCPNRPSSARTRCGSKTPPGAGCRRSAKRRERRCRTAPSSCGDARWASWKRSPSAPRSPGMAAIAARSPRGLASRAD